MWAVILLGLAELSVFQAPLCLQSSWCYIDIRHFCLLASLYLLVSLVGLALDLID